MTSEIEHLYRIEKFLESMSDLNLLLEAIIRECSAALNAESASLALYDEQSTELYFYAVGGGENEAQVGSRLKSIRMKMGAGVIGWCAEHRASVIINDVYSDPRFDKGADSKTGFVTRSILAVPMIRGEKLIGVVEGVNKRNAEGFTGNDEKILSVLAAQAGLVIENSRLHQENVRQARLSAMGQGIAGAAHCIKNILNSIGGGEFVIETGFRKKDLKKVEKGWEVLKRNTRIMKELVLDMLTYSRPREPELAPSDINRICTEIAELVGERAGEKNVAVTVDLDTGIGEISLDPKGIYRCILNLVSNAVDACDKPAGAVTISTGRGESGNGLTVAVADNGSGISRENLDKLFNVFFSTKGSKGTGLGLSVTEKIIGEHGGTIAVTSEPGEGTTFTIRLPA